MIRHFGFWRKSRGLRHREVRRVDEEKEDLKRQVAELTDRLQQQQNATPTADDQMALLEKSYELAAKYMNGGQGQVAQVPVTGGIDRKPDAVLSLIHI